jgi:hypothetical protein
MDAHSFLLALTVVLGAAASEVLLVGDRLALAGTRAAIAAAKALLAAADSH